ncbi:MAG: hypothetical protein ABI396_18090, partial [Ktedonobacteraceae bacterium]
MNDGQGDRKGSPLLYTQSVQNMQRNIVGAIPCGRPGSYHCRISNHSQTLKSSSLAPWVMRAEIMRF